MPVQRARNSEMPQELVCTSNWHPAVPEGQAAPPGAAWPGNPAAVNLTGNHLLRTRMLRGVGGGRSILPPTRFAPPAPRRGHKIAAQGKAAKPAALGKEPPTQSLLPFRLGAPLVRQAGREKRGNHFASGTQGGAALALGYYHIVPTGLRFGSRRSHNRRTPYIGALGQWLWNSGDAKSSVACTQMLGDLWNEGGRNIEEVGGAIPVSRHKWKTGSPICHPICKGEPHHHPRQSPRITMCRDSGDHRVGLAPAELRAGERVGNLNTGRVAPFLVTA